jgi:hypothetical protein
MTLTVDEKTTRFEILRIPLDGGSLPADVDVVQFVTDSLTAANYTFKAVSHGTPMADAAKRMLNSLVDTTAEPLYAVHIVSSDEHPDWVCTILAF